MKEKVSLHPHDPITISIVFVKTEKTPVKPQNIDARHQKVHFNSRSSSTITTKPGVIQEVPLWLTLHAFVWCSLRCIAPCVSSCSGTGCRWAEWQATTRPSTSVWRPGGPLSWLSWGWKDERNSNVPPTVSVSRPGNATAVPVLYWHVHVPAALILPRHAHTQLILHYPALSCPATWWTSVEISSA